MEHGGLHSMVTVNKVILKTSLRKLIFLQQFYEHSKYEFCFTFFDFEFYFVDEKENKKNVCLKSHILT